jgi:cobaltochelatase CobT
MAGPFPAATFDAVGGCTRALAGNRDADALLDSSDAATLGALRAFADRLALRAMHHDARVHIQHQPQEAHAAAVFTALEQARLDALGVQWLAGVARNLMSHPGTGEDGARWLAFEVFSSRDVPQNARAAAARARNRLPTPLVQELSALTSVVRDHAAFAPRAAAWTLEASRHLEPPRDREPFPLPLRHARGRKLPGRGDPGATSAPLRKPQREEAPQESDFTATGSGTISGSGAADAGYRAFTRAHDRVVNAASLASREELAQLRARLESELTTVRSVVARLAKRLMRVLMARQVRAWSFDLDEGVIDGSRLAALVASPGSTRPFKQESESPFPSTVVSLLIDHSGSMRGRPMLIAALTVEIFARVLERCGVKCEVLGFTTRDWDGGVPAREWAASGYPENPGRLNALEHIIIKGADIPWRRARVSLGLFLRDEMLKENVDGEALSWAHERLRARSELRKILVVVSDGTPMDEATMAANGHEYLERHLQHVVQEIESKSAVRLAAIGIGHDVSTFYQNATRVAGIDQLGPALSGKLISLLQE